MTGLSAPTPAEPADHPLRAALAQGDRVHADSAPALHYLLAIPDRSLTADAVVAQVRGMLTDMAGHLAGAQNRSIPSSEIHETVLARLSAEPQLRAHCQALALEWRLAQALEAELALDPVLSPRLQRWVGEGEGPTGSLAMAALAAQARFVQAQRRMELPLYELPAELFHTALTAANAALSAGEVDPRAEARLRSGYDEAATRLALLARLASTEEAVQLPIEEAGVALWLSAIAARSGEARDRTACAAADPHLGRLLLTLRAAGASSAEAERQALRVQPDATLPHGLSDIGTREAAQWLAEVRA